MKPGGDLFLPQLFSDTAGEEGLRKEGTDPKNKHINRCYEYHSTCVSFWAKTNTFSIQSTLGGDACLVF